MSAALSLEQQIAADMEQMIAFHEMVQNGGKPEETLRATFKEQLQEVRGVATELFTAIAARQQQVAGAASAMTQQVVQAANLDAHSQQLAVLQQADASFQAMQKKLFANLQGLRQQIQERTEHCMKLQANLNKVKQSGKRATHEKEIDTVAAAACKKAAETAGK